VTITGANDKPTTVADTQTISEGATAVVMDVLSNDSDDESDTLSVFFVTAASTKGGAVTLTDGVVKYTPITTDFNGEDTFQYIAKDGTDESALTTVTVTVDKVNDDPTGSVTIAGDAKTGQTLTASNTIADVDGLGSITYSWTGTKDGEDNRTATGETLVLTDDDVGYVYTVAAGYTDDDGTAESVAAATPTSAVVDIVKLVQIRNISETTESAASIDLYTTDGTGGSTKKLIQFEVWLDATDITGLGDNGNATEIRAVEWDFDWTSTLEVFGISLTETSLSIVGGSVTDYIGTKDTTELTLNGATGAAVIAGDGTAIVNTDTSDDSIFAGNIQIEKKIATMYVNPTDTEIDVDIILKDFVVATDDGEVVPLVYSVDIL